MKQRENALPGRIVPKDLKTKDAVVLLSSSPPSPLLMMQRTKHYRLSLPFICREGCLSIGGMNLVWYRKAQGREVQGPGLAFVYGNLSEEQLL